ncbi:unnamed protein product [Gongylonema pulchrum]|uniref:Homeobox domain-containing protein n=1 Tax=Gongylonema pulchrum TaxID=637853 RepID=A0A183ECD1_9BILA|nr:unnamed protein product [Gongylonema pulchrum]
MPPACNILFNSIHYTDSKGEVKEMLFPKALDLFRPKRPRTTFTSQQLAELEQEFLRNPYLTGDERTKLAEKLHLSDTQVTFYFG